MFLWPFKILRVQIYFDTIVFKELGFHPLLVSKFGVAFENICDYELKRLISGFSVIVLKRNNGKRVRRFMSLTENEYTEFSKLIEGKSAQIRNK